MSFEHLSLIVSWSEIRPGMLVVTMGCTQCSRPHRGIVMRHYAQARGKDGDGNIVISEAWTMLPGAHGMYWYGLTPSTVQEKRAFRVVDPVSDRATDQVVEEKTPGRLPAREGAN